MKRLTKAQVKATVVEIVAKQLEIPQTEVTDIKRLSADPAHPKSKKLGCDMFERCVVIVSCENKFGIQISDDDERKIGDVGSLKAICVKLTGVKC